MSEHSPASLTGSFVVEVGERQGWEFLGFCNNGTTPPTERRLYIDTEYRLSGVDDLRGLMHEVVAALTVASGRLSITFESGASITVSAEPTATTTHDVWWFGTPQWPLLRAVSRQRPRAGAHRGGRTSRAGRARESVPGRSAASRADRA